MNQEKIGNIELLILKVEQNYTKQSMSEKENRKIGTLWIST
jgi:hypothetical protein